MPASGITPTLEPVPPEGHSTGPMTGAPVMPSPTTGSSSVKILPTLNGQPGRNGLPSVLPSLWIAYTRLLPYDSAPVDSSAATDAVFAGDTLIPPSPGASAAYSSLVPTTISGDLSPVMSPTAGVSMIAPWFSSLPALSLNVTWWVAPLIDATFVRSTTSNGKPGRRRPSWFHT